MVPTGIQSSQWMSRVPGNLSLAALSIPGTHDSACRRGHVKLGWASLGGDFVFTQDEDNDILKQLNMGIRFFDYRIENGGNLRHGSAELDGNLFEELRNMAEYLQKFGSECICVSIKWEKEEISILSASSNAVPEPEHEAAWVIGRMVETCGRDRLWLTPRVPTLDEARGKIVFLTRFNTVTPEGIRYSPGGENVDDRTKTLYRSQDHYDLTSALQRNAPAEKFHEHVRPFMIKAIESKNELDVWYFNFTSGYAGQPPGWDHLNPIEIARDCEFQGQQLRGVNEWLKDFLRGVASSNMDGAARVGTLLMDFVDADLVRSVYETNHFS